MPRAAQVSGTGSPPNPMLRNLSIRDFAIIERLDIELGPGLNALTGETGAGKSIIVDALTVILGGRADSSLVRSGALRASIDAVFDIAGSPSVRQIVDEAGFDCEDEQLLLSRDISASGKSSVRIGGRPATVTQLREIGEWLVDLHGQHEHQSLLSVARHLSILDEWGGAEVAAARESVASTWQEARRLRQERDNLERDARERAHLLDLYAFQVEEIDGASLSEGEDTEVEADLSRLANAQRLTELVGQAASALAPEEGPGASEAIAAAVQALEEAAAVDKRLATPLETLRSVSYEVEEAARDLCDYRDSIESSPERLRQAQERSDQIRELKRKYGDTIEEVLAYGRATSAKLDRLTNSEQRSGELGAALARCEEDLARKCADLSALRKSVAGRFADAVLRELADLAMERTRFEVSISECAPNQRGADDVEFLIAPNPGEPLRPLAKIASGGEISRVMLAIKTAMARQEPLPTMVFDEVDAGVGGRTATNIGEKLAALARNAQIICITHLPQIASLADTHYVIEKSVVDDRAAVSLTCLSEEERVPEIARMLGGATLTDAVLRHAREMLDAR